jgi:DNA mismatch repair ATPase MutS
MLIDSFFLWDLFQITRVENWKLKHRQYISAWFDVIAEVDASCSFANYSFNNSEYTFPEICSNNELISAEKIGHPLISQKDRITNDIFIDKEQFIIITGANMAGKSTFIRTVAINMILGMCGAPVCAKRMSFKPIDIFTSIHSKDSLHKNESYFYNELKRLKRIIEKLQAGIKVFVVLDEILKGTNSKDKHIGSMALITQLINLKASGILATHDVSLAELAERFPREIVTFCFEITSSGNIISFDYKLRKGISQNMNATLLMKEMGITI